MPAAVFLRAGVVVEVLEESPIPLLHRYHPDFLASVRSDAPGDVRQGWTWDGVAYRAPPAPVAAPLEPG